MQILWEKMKQQQSQNNNKRSIYLSSLERPPNVYWKYYLFSSFHQLNFEYRRDQINFAVARHNGLNNLFLCFVFTSLALLYETSHTNEMSKISLVNLCVFSVVLTIQGEHVSSNDEHEYDCGAIERTFAQKKLPRRNWGWLKFMATKCESIEMLRKIGYNFVSRTRLRLIINCMKVKLGERWRRKEKLCGKELIMVERVDANRWNINLNIA